MHWQVTCNNLDEFGQYILESDWNASLFEDECFSNNAKGEVHISNEF